METAEVLEDLQASFQGWSFWRDQDDTGNPASWWASRQRLLTEHEMSAGLHHTLAADTVDDLLGLLEEQTRLEKSSPGQAR